MPAAVETLEDPQAVHAVGQPRAVAAVLLDRRRLLDRRHGAALAGQRRTGRLLRALQVLHAAVVVGRLTEVVAARLMEAGVAADTQAAVVVGTTSVSLLTGAARKK